MAIATNPRGQLRITLAAVLVAGCAALLAPSQASAFSCFRSAGDNLLTIDLEGGEDVTITRDGVNFDISSAGTPATHCGATVNNVDSVDIDAAGGAERIILDLSNGFFGPGATAESGADEIEFSADPGQCINCQFNSGDRLELLGGSGSDTFNFFDDAITLNDDPDFEVSLLGPVRRTVIDAAGGADTVHGGTGIFTHQNRMEIGGGDGVDDLTGGGLADTMDGGGSADTMQGGEDDDSINGGTGNDTVHGGVEDDTIDGGSGDDMLLGDAGDDNFDGVSTAPDGADTFTGGLGTDTVGYGGRQAPLHASVGDGADDGEAGEGDNLTDVEDLTGGQGGDELVGSEGSNVLLGGSGDDSIAGLGGQDQESGGPDADTFLQGASPDGADTIAGNTGIDRLDYGERSAAVTATLGGLADDGETGEGDAVLVEDAEGGAGDDIFAGNGASNVLDGGRGDDSLAGGPAGADSLIGGKGNDTADYSVRVDELSISLDGEANDGAPGEGDSASTENATGGSSSDDITGDSRGNRLRGGDGDDDISGGDGADRIEGGVGEDEEYVNAGDDAFRQGGDDDGADRMTGGSGKDTVDYRERKDSVSVSFNGIQDDGGGVENDDVGVDVENAIGGLAGDHFVGSGAKNRLDGRKGEDLLRGGDDDDALLGGDSADRLYGEAGDDRLDGGGGNDRCSGGGGSDTLQRCES